MLKSLEIVHNDLVHKRKCINYYVNSIEGNEFLGALLNEIDKLELIEKDLMILDILLDHLDFMGENKSSLKLINNGCLSKNSELYIVKIWLLSKK